MTHSTPPAGTRRRTAQSAAQSAAQPAAGAGVARPRVHRAPGKVPGSSGNAPGNVVQQCRHCSGTGREPRTPLDGIVFSRAGELRGRQQELSAITGISAPMISRIFAGDVTPSAANLIRLATALGCTVDRLLQLPAIAARING